LTFVPSEYKVALLPGDGIGPEVIAEGVKVLYAVGRRYDLQFRVVEAPIGGVALEETGAPLPETTIEQCRQADAILFGAVGGPRWDHEPLHRRPEAGLLKLRSTLRLYANLRPIHAFASLAAASPIRPEVLQGTDLLIVRELTGGLYFGQPRGREQDSAIDTLKYTTTEIVRVVRLAFAVARQRRRRLTSVDKANVLESSRLWREVVDAEACLASDVTVEHMLVDTCAMNLVRAPSRFDVIVTENMFGDILSDEAGGLVGSLGLLPSASLGAEGPSLYEPVHGSAPDIAGKGIANPIGAILSVAMMLHHSFKQVRAAVAVEAAVTHVLDTGLGTADLGGVASTSQVGDRIAEWITAEHLVSAEGVDQ